MSTKSRFVIVASLLLGSITFAEQRAKLYTEADHEVPGRNLSVAAGPRCPDPADLYAQCPDFGPNGSEARFLEFSDGAGDISLADNFSLPDGGTIHRIRWWGMYLLMGSNDGCVGRCAVSLVDDFTVFIWADVNGTPGGGQPLLLPVHAVIREAEDVGELIVGLGPAPICEYELTFAKGGFVAEPGKTYWIEVRNNLDPFCNWVWMTAPSPPGDASCRQRTPSTDPSWSTPTLRGFDLAVSFLRDDSIPAASTLGAILLSLILLSAGAVLIRSRSQRGVGSRRPGAGAFLSLALVSVGATTVDAVADVIPRTVPQKPASVTPGAPAPFGRQDRLDFPARSSTLRWSVFDASAGVNRMTKRFLIALCFVLPGGSIAIAFFAVGAKETRGPTPHEAAAHEVPHERREHDAYRVRSATVPAGVVARSGPVVRGRFSSVQVNVDALGQNIPGDAANEPSIAIDPTNPNNIVIGWRQFDSVQSNFRQAGYAYSRDAGETWTFPGSIMPGVFNSDPVLAVSPEGVFYYATIDLQLGRLFRSVDAGATWSEPTIFCEGFCDKEWVAVDHSSGVGRGNIYIVLNGGGLTGSTDGGVTFGIRSSVAGRIVTLSVDDVGNVYAFGGASVSISRDARLGVPFPQFVLLASLDLQVVNPIVPTTFQPGGVNGSGLLGQPWIAAAPPGSPCPGRVHVLNSTRAIGGDPLDVAFARSENRGVTWSDPVRVNDDPMDNGAVQWFGTLSVAPNGRIDAIWNDTRNTGRGNLSEVFYSFSYDGGGTWSKNVPVTPVWDSTLGWPQQQKIGDYYDMISDDGGANLAYAATFNGEQDVYFIRLIPEDCNGNGVPDAEDIASGFSADVIVNGIPDECESDIDGDLVSDRCDADLDNDGVPNVDDLCPRVPLFLPADADGRAPQDTDGDCRIALNDYHRMQPCLGLSIPGTTSETCVARFDADGDLDVDLEDFRLFQLEFGRDGR